MGAYDNFKTLMAGESEFRIDCCDRNSDITILAPHGGKIEPHTSEIARLIAADNCNYYSFNGEKGTGNQALHLASHCYDEPKANTLVRKSHTVITVHGCREKDAFIHIGGLNKELGKKIRTCLTERAIPCSLCSPDSPFGGTNPANICNRGLSGKGVQLEISRALRDSCTAWNKIAEAVRKALGLEKNDGTSMPV